MNQFKFIMAAVLMLASAHVFATENAATTHILKIWVGDAELGKAKSAVCAGCHGVDGNSAVPTFPKLAGQNERYLSKQLRDFKKGIREDSVMEGIVKTLTRVDIQNLAAFYASQDISRGHAKEGANIELGKKIYRGGKVTGVTACIACHGVHGQGIPSAGFPMLASQHAAYTAEQLRSFRQSSINEQTGEIKHSRSNSYGKMMTGLTKTLNNEEIDALAEYITDLRD